MLKPSVVGELTEKRGGKKYGQKRSGGGLGTPIFLYRRQWMACREFLLPGSETGVHWHQIFMPKPAVVSDLIHGDYKKNYRTIRSGGVLGCPKSPIDADGPPLCSTAEGGRERGRQAKHPCPRSALSAMEGEWSAAAKRSCRGRTPPLQWRGI